jgi:chemotaxis protein MotB
MARSRRELRHLDTWPGYVDALTTLLLVIFFLLVVFVLAQFFLNQVLQGKDTRLQSLEQAIVQLTEQLDMEQASSAELRLSVARLTSDLQAAQAAREDTEALLARTESERDEFRDQLFLLEDEKALLTQTLNELRVEADESEELQAELERSVDLRARLEEELEKARQTVTADQATIETQLAQLIQLRRDIDALQKVRDDLETQVTEMAALLQAAEVAKGGATQEIARLADLLEAAQAETAGLEERVEELSQSVATAGRETQSLESEIARLTNLLETARQEKEASDRQVADLRSDLETIRDQDEGREQRLAELSQQLEQARDERTEREQRIAALVAQLEAARSGREETAASAEELRQARERLMLELTQVRDRSKELEARLSSEEERTALAQRQLDERDVRIAELLRAAGRTEEALATEQALSGEALNQVEILNRQINALRVQLAALAQALDLEQQKVEEQQVTITDLGSKLNMALAGRVEELSRFRSEFFGRLREVLGERPDVRIVGDRFVFQSEVLFPSGSAEIQPGGRDELGKLADSLNEIAADIPSDVPWVLQINGHTDRRPISTPEFPSNWELSTARATNVAKFLISQGIPAERLAAAGFAQFQPLDDRNDEIAYRRNRRIELKLTSP